MDPTYLSRLGIQHYNYSEPTSVDEVASSRGYKNRDEITISPSTLGAAYEDKVKMFFHEHLHEDEEIRYILDGGGYFDVRSREDDWVRIRLEKGDLMIMPAGIYHRFTTDDKNVSRKQRDMEREAGAHELAASFGAGSHLTNLCRSTPRRCACSKTSRSGRR